MSYEILGQIIAEETGQGLRDLRVIAYLTDFTERTLGETITNPDGTFKLEYSKEVFEDFYSYEEPALHLELYNPKGAQIHSTDGRFNPKETTTFDVKLSQTLMDVEPESFII